MKHGVQALLRLAIGGVPPESDPAPPPTVTSITPNTGENTGTVQITDLAGANFQTGATAQLTKVGETAINGTSVVVVSSSKITCNFDLTGAVTGLWNVKVKNPDQQSGTLSNGFTVTGSPPSGYYVSTSGSDSNPGTFEEPWRHMNYAINQLSPGDTLWVRGGTYDELVTVGVSGTSGNPITIRNYGSEVPVMRDTGDTGPWKWKLNDQSYLHLIGLKWYNYPGGAIQIRSYNAAMTQITIENCIFEDQVARGNGYNYHTIYVVGDSDPITYIRVIGCQFINIDTYIPATGNHSDTVTCTGDVNYIVYDGNSINECSNIGLNIVGTTMGQPQYVVIKNNTIRKTGMRGIGTGIYLDGAGGNVIVEGNIVYECVRTGIAVSMERTTAQHGTQFVVRGNVFWDNFRALGLGGGWSNKDCADNKYPKNVRVCHNTVHETQSDKQMVAFYCVGNGGGPGDYRVKNNIWSEETPNIFKLYTDGNATNDMEDTQSDYNIHHSAGGGDTDWSWDEANYETFALYQSGSGQDGNSLTSDPLFVNKSAHNYNLQSGSPARNAAGPLTTCNGGGSGTSVTVHDARWFADGYGLQDGDMIRIGGGAVVEVTGVNYGTNVLTIAESRTWNDGDRVDYDYMGTAPDMGALEYSE